MSQSRPQQISGKIKLETINITSHVTIGLIDSKPIPSFKHLTWKSSRWVDLLLKVFLLNHLPGGINSYSFHLHWCFFQKWLLKEMFLPVESTL